MTSAYTFAYTLAAGCACALLFVQFVHSASQNEGGGVQLVYEGTCCLVWGVIDRKRDTNVVYVFSILTRVGVYMGVCVCLRAHTHTLHTWGSCL